MQPQTIEMHFTEIMRLARILNDQTRTLKTVGEEELMQIIRENKSCWNSECADILLQKEVRLGNELIREAEKLEKTALEMETKAKKMYQSEWMNVCLGTIRRY